MTTESINIDGWPCVIALNYILGIGNCYCGYIGVSADHPWFGKDYEELIQIQVHGGLTFSGSKLGDIIDLIGAPWWLGFDCVHFGDNIIECNRDFVIRELTGLVRQAKAAAK